MLPVSGRSTQRTAPQVGLDRGEDQLGAGAGGAHAADRRLARVERADQVQHQPQIGAHRLPFRERRVDERTALLAEVLPAAHGELLMVRDAQRSVRRARLELTVAARRDRVCHDPVLEPDPTIAVGSPVSRSPSMVQSPSRSCICASKRGGRG